MAVGPETDRQNQQNHNRAGRLTALGLSFALVAAGAVGYDIYSNSNKKSKSQQPEQTPQGVIAEPTPTPSETIIYTPTPALTPSPTPEPTPEGWWNEIPPNPYKNINDVPLAKDLNGFATIGSLDMTPGLNESLPYGLQGVGLTIVDVEPDIKDNLVWIGATTGGNRIEKTDCSIAVMPGLTETLCDYSGVTLWLKADSNTYVTGGPYGPTLGHGLDILAQYLKVGNSVVAQIPVYKPPYTPSLISGSELDMNQHSWNELRNGVGQITPPRSDRIYSFKSIVFEVNTTQK